MPKYRLDELLDESINNIREDRAAANKLLVDLIIYMSKEGDAAHNAVGNIATSYLETLQRSNEQLVKITGLLQKEQGNTKSLSASDKEGIFDLIKEK